MACIRAPLGRSRADPAIAGAGCGALPTDAPMRPRHVRTDLPAKRSVLVITTTGLSVLAGGCAAVSLATV
jgi:hypothetical protein